VRGRGVLLLLVAVLLWGGAGGACKVERGEEGCLQSLAVCYIWTPCCAAVLRLPTCW
jgi:hypothetical protein